MLALLGAAPGPGLDAAHLFPPAWTRLRAECLALALAPVLVADRSLLIAMLRRLRRADCSAAALRRLVRPGLIDDPADRRLMRILAHLDGRLRLDLEQPAGSHRRALTIEPLWPAGLLSLSRIHKYCCIKFEGQQSQEAGKRLWVTGMKHIPVDSPTRLGCAGRFRSRWTQRQS